MSDCERYSADLSGLFTGGLSDERRRELEEHATSCPECRRRREAFAKLFEAGGLLAEAVARRVPHDLAERVRDRIEAGEAGAAGASVKRRARRAYWRRFIPRSRRAGPRYLAASLAAAAALFFVVLYGNLRRPAPVPSGRRGRAAQTGGEAEKALEAGRPRDVAEVAPPEQETPEAPGPRTAARSVEGAARREAGEDGADEEKRQELVAVDEGPAASPPAGQETEEPIARVGKVEGMVMYSRGVLGRWARAREGVPLLAGDRIDTRTGTARLDVEHGAAVHLNRSTLLRIFAAETDSGEMTLASLARGEIYIEDVGSRTCAETADGLFSPVGTRFNVKREPSATLVVVAGGSVRVRARPKGQRKDSVGFSRGEGSMDLRGRRWVGRPVRVDSGYRSRVIKGQRPTAPVEADVARAVAWCGARTPEGLAALYTFGEESGAGVRDVCPGRPALDLTVGKPAAARRVRSGLAVGSSSIVASAGPAKKIMDACMKSNALTIEAWIEPATAAQHQDARIVTLSSHAALRNFTLMQTRGRYNVRLRTTETSPNGMPSVMSPQGLISTRLAHVVYTRDASGEARLYVDGIVRTREKIGGDFSNWDEDHRLALANEFVDERPWLGTYRLVAVYARALSALEVASNWRAGPEAGAVRR